MTFGVTTEGFVKRTLEDLLAQVEEEEQSEISSSLDVSSSSPMGQINAVLMKAVAEIWDLAEAVYVGMDPDRNEDDAQDAICAITGTLRDPATKSYAKVTMALDAGITVSPGAIVSALGNPSARFVLFGPEPTPGDDPAEGDVISTIAGNYYGRFRAEETGPVVAPAGTLSVIITPVSGWLTSTNALDAVVGEDIESNSDLRLRREDELQAIGTSPVDALRGELLELDGMQQVQVFENVTDVTDVNGVPPHSIEALCYDGPAPAVDDDDIAQVLWDGKAAGIRTYGSETGDAEDTQGGTRVMSFSRPDQKTVYFTITLDTNSSYPGDLAVQEAVVEFGQERHNLGDDVILAAFYGTIFGLGGVEDITGFLAGFTSTPVGTSNLTIGVRELATFDTSRIVVNS